MSHPEIIRQIKIRRVKAGSLFKLIFIVSLSVFTPYCLIYGIAALFGANTVTFGNSHITGILGLIEAIVIIPIFSLLFGSFFWFAAYLGIRISGKFSPLIVDYVAYEETETGQAPQPTEITPPNSNSALTTPANDAARP